MSERITLVEIDVKRCSLTHGVGACGASGTPCFNSFATCQSKPDYSETIVKACYSTPTNNANPEVDCLPSLIGVSERPAMLSLGESIGTRSSMTASFADHPYPDTGAEGDYYIDKRDYDPFTTGTYWGKFRARYPFMQGWSARVLQGTTDQQPQEMETRHFIIDTFSGPDSEGKVTLVMKDALKLADGKKAHAPKVSIGELAADITSSETAFVLTPVGVGDQYPMEGVLAIGGDEIITYTNRNGDIIFGVQRGQFNTEATEHDQGARVQLCLQYSSERVTDILQEILRDYANVPNEFIPIESWRDEDDVYIQRRYTALIAEPTPVNTLVNELLEQTASTIWWDDYGKQLRFRVLREVSGDAFLYDDDIIKAGSFSSADQNDKRVSQVWTYYGQINPLEQQDDPSNYSRSVVTVSPESEQNFDGTPSIKRVFSRWIGETGADAAQRLNLLILSRYTTPPRLISWTLQRNPALLMPTLGSGYRVSSWTMQKPTGETDTVPVQVVQIKTTSAEHRVVAEEVLYSETVAPDEPNVKRIPFETTRTNVNLYTEALNASFTPPASGDTYIFTVRSGTVIGSNSTSAPALTTGTGWPSGVTIRLVIEPNSFIVGRGGDGGESSFFGGDANMGTTITAGSGTNGGAALDAIVSIEIDNQAIIGGGGGGGGGASVMSGALVDGALALAGGSGGRGSLNSLGGLATYTNPFNGPAPQGRTINNGFPGGLSDGGGENFVTATYVRGSTTYTAQAKGGRGGNLGENGDNGAIVIEDPENIFNDNGNGLTDPALQSKAALGGSAGPAVIGDSNITWTNLGEIRGPRL